MRKKKKTTNTVKKKQNILKLNKAELDLLKSVGMKKTQFNHMYRMGMPKKEILLWASTQLRILKMKRDVGKKPYKKPKDRIRVYPWLTIEE